MALIDPMDFKNNELLSNLQGNILKGHGRDHTTHIFVEFKEDQVNNVKKWIADFTKNHITSCKKQLRDRELYKRNKVSGGLFASFFLTSTGYDYLGFDNKTPGKNKMDPAFLTGLKTRRGVTNDPPLDKWEKGYQKKIHAMVLLADDDMNNMGTKAKDVLNALEEICAICSVEYGHAIRNANKDGLEHFGYVDGISQPLFLEDEMEEYKYFHNIPNNDMLFDPSAEKELVLVPDPFVEQNPNALTCYGSYFVFRKLEQNVKAFKELEKELGAELYDAEADEEKRELIGAYLVGRFEDGTPAVMDSEEGMIGSGNFNNFNYDNDSTGGRCPYFAHIRKTNPRRNGKPDKSHIMARRGIPYGMRNVDTAIDPIPLQMPEGDVGLLFMSYQADLRNQFELIQRYWSNDKDFEIKGTGIDAIIGQSKSEAEKEEDRKYKFPEVYGDPTPSFDQTFDQFVTFKGGEYFFAPSMRFLRGLGVPEII